MNLFSTTAIYLIFAYLSIPSACAPAESEVHGNKVVSVAKKPFKAQLAGSLLMPSDGAQFVNQGGAMGDIQLIYKCPESFAHTEIGERTVSIDVVLVPRREQGFKPGPSEVVLARGLRARIGDNGERIQTNFVPPATACGDYRMVVTENQIFNNAVVQLASGAPTVSVACSAMTDY